MSKFFLLIKYFLLVSFFIGQSIYASSLKSKYPSYRYVFSEFDVDSSYIYDDAFVSFARKNEQKLKKFYQSSLVRGKEILPIVQGLLLENSVSDLFTYLAMVESAFNTEIVSTKQAVGLWQFMEATAKQYDLTVSKNYDERYDIVFSTSAAIAYLNKLHKQFGKWYIAAMAYNCGEGRMAKAIKRAGTDNLSILTDDKEKYLPKETREYIKKLLLVTIIGENSTVDFGHENNDVIEDGLIRVEVAGGTSLKALAKLLKMDEKKLLKLNKSLKNAFVPKEKKRHEINIPIENIFAFYLRYEFPNEKIQEQELSKSHMVSHYVKLGETLESVAKLYKVNMEVIRIANNLKNNFLVLDNLLLIPVSQKMFESLDLSKDNKN